MVILDYFSLILISIGLSADAFAATVSVNISNKKPSLVQKLKIASLFGLFQATMPLIACFLGSAGASVIEKFDHWIAFVLLLYVGINMLIDVRKEKKYSNVCLGNENTYSFKKMLLLAIATSIDALASGFLLPTVIKANSAKLILVAISIIGTITFLLSVLASYLAENFGRFLKYKAQIFGACLLIFIGIKILLQHLFFV